MHTTTTSSSSTRTLLTAPLRSRAQLLPQHLLSSAYLHRQAPTSPAAATSHETPALAPPARHTPASGAHAQLVRSRPRSSPLDAAQEKEERDSAAPIQLSTAAN